MSEVTITGIFEKINNIFSLFKALLTPGKFQDSVLWQKEVLIILALGLCLITAISFIAFNLISTLKKRQRNYKELVSALEDDGVNIDYNLKPLVVDKFTEAPPIPTTENHESSFEISPNNIQHEKYSEELTSKFDNESYSKSNLYESQQFFTDSETSVITPSHLKTEKKIFSLTQGHLTFNESKANKEAGNVIHLSKANLKVEPARSEKLENETLPLEKDNFSEENIDISKDFQFITSNVTPDAKSAPNYPEENHSTATPISVDNTVEELNSIQDEDEEFIELPLETYQENETINEEPSIRDEVKGVITGLESFNPEHEKENNISHPNSDEIPEDFECLHDDNFMDSIGLEAESVLAEFSGKEVWDSQEENIPGSEPNQPFPDSTSSTNSTENGKFPSDELSKCPEVGGKKTLSNTKKTVEFLLVTDDSIDEDAGFIPDSNPSEIKDGIDLPIESETNDECSTDLAQPIVNNYFKNRISTEPPLESTDNNIIETNVEEGIDELPLYTEDQNMLTSEKLVLPENIKNHIEKNKIAVFEDCVEDIQNSFEQPSQTEHNATELNSIVEAGDKMISKQLLLDFEIDSKQGLPKINENNTSETMQPEIETQRNENHLSQKTARRIIERLEFFKKNINKSFQQFS